VAGAVRSSEYAFAEAPTQDYLLSKFEDAAMPIDPWNVLSADFGTVAKPSTAFVTLLDLAIYFAFSFKVSLARRKYKVAAPSIDGPEPFQRIFRVHQNMVEQMVLHLPLLWLAAFAMDDMFAAAFGAVWALGRVLYARGYYQKPKRRTKGLLISLAADAVLFLGILTSVIASF